MVTKGNDDHQEKEMIPKGKNHHESFLPLVENQPKVKMMTKGTNHQQGENDDEG
jgi:hypothetical protein